MTEKEATDNLYNAVKEYIKSIGGKAILGSAITIEKNPTAKVWDEFTVSVKISGRLPEKKLNNQNPL